MAIKRWIGNALQVAQIDTLVLDGVLDVGDSITLTINNKDLEVIASSEILSEFATKIATAWNASTIAEFAEITALASGDSVILTHDTPGIPFTLTATMSVSLGTGTDDIESTQVFTQAATGKWYWDNQDNWSTGSVPVNGDDVYIEDSDVDIRYGLNQSAVTLSNLYIRQNYTGKIGLANTTTNGYYEYRSHYLRISATNVHIGAGGGAGSGRIKLDVGSNACTLAVDNSGNAESDNLPATLFKGSNASNVININKGSIGIAVEAGDTATVATLRASYIDNIAGDVDLVAGAGVTLTTISQSGGSVELNSGFTTLNKTDGETLINDGSVTTLNLDGGELIYSGTGTIANLNVGSGANADFSKDIRSRTVTNCTLQAGATLKDPFKTVTWTNPITLDRCGIPDLTIDVGQNITLQPA